MQTSISEILDALPVKQNGIVFHVGNGTTRAVLAISEKVPSGKVISVDLKNTIIKSKHSNIKNLKIDIDKGSMLPLKNSFCDVVIISHAIRYIVYRESFLKECFRILKPGGLIIVIESKPDSFGVSVGGDARIITDDMLEYLDRAGFLLGENFDTNHDEYGIIGVCPLHIEE